MDEIDRIVSGLCELEREWLTGWPGPPGAAYNEIGEGLQEMGLLVSPTNWCLNATGLAVRARLMGEG